MLLHSSCVDTIHAEVLHSEMKLLPSEYFVLPIVLLCGCENCSPG